MSTHRGVTTNCSRRMPLHCAHERTVCTPRLQSEVGFASVREIIWQSVVNEAALGGVLGAVATLRGGACKQLAAAEAAASAASCTNVENEAQHREACAPEQHREP